MKVTLLGVGMGNGSLTTKAQAALGEADVLLGARRVLDSIPGFCGERVATYASGEILSFLQSHPGMPPGSGGLQRRHRLLQRCAAAPPLVGGARHPSRGASRHLHGAGPRGPAGDSWQEFCLVSAHGVDTDVLAPLLNHPSVFYLTGGKWTPGAICGEFCRAGPGDTLVTVASNLSYPEEEVVTATAKDDRPSAVPL